MKQEETGGGRRLCRGTAYAILTGPSPLWSPHALAACSIYLSWFRLQFQPPFTMEEWSHSGCLLSTPGSLQPSPTQGTGA